MRLLAAVSGFRGPEPLFTIGTSLVAAFVLGTVRYKKLPFLQTLTTDSSPLSSALTCAQFHPDGLIFGTGTMDSQIKIWDLKVGHGSLPWSPEGEGNSKVWWEALGYVKTWESLALCDMVSVTKEL